MEYQKECCLYIMANTSGDSITESADNYDNEFFVHVDTTNTRINDFHRKSSFQNKEERSID